MHDRKRAKLDAEKEEKLRQKARVLFDYQNKALAARHEATPQDAMVLTQKVLGKNSELYSLWNYRRQTIHNLVDNHNGDLGALVADELALTEVCIKDSPKSYWVWHHRRWCLELVPGADVPDVGKRELGLCDKMLSVDARNFHCWRHRLWVCHWVKETPENQLAFTKKKIQSNFSNYSAWHYRSALLKHLETTPSPSRLSEIEQEFEFLQPAVYTEPEDQSSWLYHRWLTHCCSRVVHEGKHGAGEDANANGPGSVANALALLRQQVDMCTELLSLEPGAKWPTLTKAFVLSEMAKGDGLGQAESDDLRALVASLKDIDPMRTSYYDHLLASI